MDIQTITYIFFLIGLVCLAAGALIGRHHKAKIAQKRAAKAAYELTKPKTYQRVATSEEMKDDDEHYRAFANETVLLTLAETLSKSSEVIAAMTEEIKSKPVSRSSSAASRNPPHSHGHHKPA